MFFICTITSMMSGTHFYLMLPSNASPDVYPDTKTGYSYRVKLQQVYLHGNWEVGLYSIFYPNTRYTTPKKEPYLLQYGRHLLNCNCGSKLL